MINGKAQPATKAVQSKCQNASLPDNNRARIKSSLQVIRHWPMMTNWRRSTRSVMAPPTSDTKIIGTATTRLMYASDWAEPVRSQARIVRVSIWPCMAKKKATLPKNSQRNSGIDSTEGALALLAAGDSNMVKGLKNSRKRRGGTKTASGCWMPGKQVTGKRGAHMSPSNGRVVGFASALIAGPSLPRCR